MYSKKKKKKKKLEQIGGLQVIITIYVYAILSHFHTLILSPG